MRFINLSNVNRINATVAFENAIPVSKTEKIKDEDGNFVSSTRILKSTEITSIRSLLRQCDNDPVELAEKIMQSDVDVETERLGMKLKELRTVYVDENSEIVFNVEHREFLYNPDGTVKEERKITETIGNMNIDDMPILMSGKVVPINEAVHRYVFSHHYYLRPINSLTNKFLYDIAKQLSDSKSLMYVGAGADGTEPLVLQKGGIKYHAFLQGKLIRESVEVERFDVVLHLTNCELRSAKEAEHE